MIGPRLRDCSHGPGGPADTDDAMFNVLTAAAGGGGLSLALSGGSGFSGRRARSIGLAGYLSSK